MKEDRWDSSGPLWSTKYTGLPKEDYLTTSHRQILKLSKESQQARKLERRASMTSVRITQDKDPFQMTTKMDISAGRKYVEFGLDPSGAEERDLRALEAIWKRGGVKGQWTLVRDTDPDTGRQYGRGLRFLEFYRYYPR